MGLIGLIGLENSSSKLEEVGRRLGGVCELGQEGLGGHTPSPPLRGTQWSLHPLQFPRYRGTETPNLGEEPIGAMGLIGLMGLLGLLGLIGLRLRLAGLPWQPWGEWGLWV